MLGDERPVAGRRPTAGSREPENSRTEVSLRGPTYRENSHADHTWHSPSRQTACFQAPEAPPVWVRSHRPLHFSLSGVSLRCPRTRASLLSSSHSLDAVFWRPSVHSRLIDSVDRPVGRARALWSLRSATDPVAACHECLLTEASCRLLGSFRRQRSGPAPIQQ